MAQVAQSIQGFGELPKEDDFSMQGVTSGSSNSKFIPSGLPPGIDKLFSDREMKKFHEDMQFEKFLKEKEEREYQEAKASLLG